MKLAKMKDGNLSAVVTAETGEAAERFKSEGYKPLCEMDGTGRKKKALNSQKEWKR